MEYRFLPQNDIPYWDWEPDYGYGEDMYYDDWIGYRDYQGPFGVLDLSGDYHQENIPWRISYENEQDWNTVQPRYGANDFPDQLSTDNWVPWTGGGDFLEYDPYTGALSDLGPTYYHEMLEIAPGINYWDW